MVESVNLSKCNKAEGKIAILGWGSLISKPEGDVSIGQNPLQLEMAFRLGGPSLPIEFCRISKDGRLTLVIDLKHGTSCETFYAISHFDRIDAARQNLAEREATPINNIHFAERGKKYGDEIKDRVADWLTATELMAAVWTGLRSNFPPPFTVETAIYYLNSLVGMKRKKAFDYIATAPKTVNSPVRDAVKNLDKVNSRNNQPH